MGIEAFCPNGHRMKVKDHLAGRLGVCPTCGSRFRLPDVSLGENPGPDVTAPLPRPTPETAGLPLARVLPLDPAVVLTLPRAVAIGTVPLGSIPLGPLGSIPLGPSGPAAQPAPVPTDPQPWSPEASPPAESLENWAASPTPRRLRRRQPRDSGGVGLSLALLVMVAAAAALAWMILRSRGLVR